jgi:hypothetical protein
MGPTNLTPQFPQNLLDDDELDEPLISTGTISDFFFDTRVLLERVDDD